MAEYIDRELAKKFLISDYAYAAAELLDDVPSADVAPILHGRWIGKNSSYDVNIHICSVCRGQVSILGNKLRYCPNCGSKMDEVKGEQK